MANYVALVFINVALICRSSALPNADVAAAFLSSTFTHAGVAGLSGPPFPIPAQSVPAPMGQAGVQGQGPFIGSMGEAQGVGVPGTLGPAAGQYFGIEGHVRPPFPIPAQSVPAPMGQAGVQGQGPFIGSMGEAQGVGVPGTLGPAAGQFFGIEGQVRPPFPIPAQSVPAPMGQAGVQVQGPFIGSMGEAQGVGVPGTLGPAAGQFFGIEGHVRPPFPIPAQSVPAPMGQAGVQGQGPFIGSMGEAQGVGVPGTLGPAAGQFFGIEGHVRPPFSIPAQSVPVPIGHAGNQGPFNGVIGDGSIAPPGQFFGFGPPAPMMA